MHEVIPSWISYMKSSNDDHKSVERRYRAEYILHPQTREHLLYLCFSVRRYLPSADKPRSTISAENLGVGRMYAGASDDTV